MRVTGKMPVPPSHWGMLGSMVALAVVGGGAVFAQVVFVEEVLWERGGGWVESQGVEGHAGAHFEGDGVVESGECVGAPCEGGVAVLEDAGDGGGVEVEMVEGFDDGEPGHAFVACGDFVGGERAADGDLAVEVVGVGGAEAGERFAGLGPCGGGGAVGMADAAGGGEGAVDFEVGVAVGGRVEGAFDAAAGFEVEDDEVFGAETVVGDPAGFDDHEGAVAVEPADIAPCEGDEAGGGEPEVGFEDLLFEIVEHGRGRERGS